MNKVYIHELVEGFLARQLPFKSNLYDLLADEPKIAGRALIEIIRRSLIEFEKNYVLIMDKNIAMPADNIYTFVDNYDAYVKGLIDEKQIELVPKVIHTVGRVALSSNYWEYRIPTLRASTGIVFTRGFYSFRLWYEYDVDGHPTVDSHIYGLDKEKRLPYYEVMFDYFVLNSLKQRTNIINLGSTIDLLRVDEQISQLRDTMEENASTSSDIFEAWR